MAKEQSGTIKHTEEQKADAVEISFFTDPLCCWSYVFEPSWQRLLKEYAGEINYRYIMCGLLPDWNSYNDPVNSVSRPAQMGPVWMQASHVSGVPIKGEIWIKDPPVSSYPACIAVKCAELQSAALGEKYLQLVRRRVMTEVQSISRQEVLENVAEELAKQDSDFDVQRFTNDLLNGTGLEAFRSDWQKAQLQRIERYPTLIFRRKGYKAVMLSGYQPYEVLQQAFQQVAPEFASL